MKEKKHPQVVSTMCLCRTPWGCQQHRATEGCRGEKQWSNAKACDRGGAETKDKRKHNSRGAREGMHVWTPVPHTFRSRMRRLPAPLCGECACAHKKGMAPRNSVNVSAVRTPPLKLAAARLLSAI